MSTTLTSNQKLFIRRMTESEEQARWGFEILLERADLADYFDHLSEAGLFSPENNSGPVPAEDPRYVRIPYWKALDYLEAAAKAAGEKDDLSLARKVIDVMHSVSGYRDTDGRVRDNYHTYRKFAEILGLVPTASVSTDDLKLIPTWLNSRYERGMVGRELDVGVLRRLLASSSPDDLKKACIVLDHCTAITWVDEEELGRNRKKPVSVVEGYWLKELIKHHANTFGIKAGREASQIFRSRVHEVFGESLGGLPTYLIRPAVEDHPQNRNWEEAANCVVQGLRDVALSWIDHEPGDASTFVADLLEDQNEMVRRIGIYVLGLRWSVLKDLYNKILNPRLFDSRNIHEVYHLLQERFSEFSEEDKRETLETIRRLSLPDIEEPDRFLRRLQRNWLSAIVGKGYEPVDGWFRELDAGQDIGRLPEHPDFNSYVETFVGPGPSPYSAEEILAFAEHGSLIEELNSFQQPNTWRGPSTTALVDSLEEAVGLNPHIFCRLLPTFLKAKRPYQYGVINGFKNLWDAPGEKASHLDWIATWRELVSFFEQLIDNPEFWKEDVVRDPDLTPNRDWIPPAIADFLRAGSKDDDKAYSTELLPRALSLVEILLSNSEAIDSVSDDAMFQAINSSKGKAIEALFSHTLMACRVSDSSIGDHVEAWASIRPTFDTELAKCKNANYEFSTLAGAYLNNIDYIDHDWLRINMQELFPKEHSDNFICAIDGLAYASASRPIYSLLLNNDVLDNALRMELRNRQARNSIIERIMLAYLWGDESLDSPRLCYLFESKLLEDLQRAIDFLSRGRRDDLETGEVTRILDFWEKTVLWTRSLAEPPKALLSELSRLTAYIDVLGDKERDLLLVVAPYVEFGYNADDFIEELDRLAEEYPDNVSIILGKVLETYRPYYDYEDRLKKLMAKLVRLGKKDDVLRYADVIRDLPGINELFKQWAKC